MFPNQNQRGLSILECEQIAERNLREALAAKELISQGGVEAEAAALMAKVHTDLSMAATYLAMYKREASRPQTPLKRHPDVSGR